VTVDVGLCAIGCALVVAMSAWCIARVRHWRGVAERVSAAGGATYGRCHAVDLRPGDLCFVWAYVLEHGEWMHGTVARSEHDRLDTGEVQLVRLVLAEGGSFTVKALAPAWVLPPP
jgi:hypothetical protein